METDSRHLTVKSVACVLFALCRHLLIRNCALILGLAILSTFKLSAQTSITGVITDFEGFTQSTTTSLNSTPIDTMNNLLAFTVGGTIYSTGVNDATLTSNSITFTVGEYVAFIPSVAEAGNAGQGSLDDGAPGNFAAGGWTTGNQVYATPAGTSEQDVREYLTDGINGLGFSTFANNVGGTFIFDLTNVDPSTVGDGIPDLIYFNMAAPSSSEVEFAFYDSGDNLIGSITGSAENAHADVAEVSNDRFRTDTGAASNTSKSVASIQQVQGFSMELSDLGITQAQMANAVELRVILPEQADPPFIAYNADAFTAIDPFACTISDADLQSIACNNNGTTANTTDDFITFTLNPTGNNLGATYNVSVSSGSVTPTSGTYGSATTFALQGGSAGSGNVTVTLADVDDAGNCKVDVVITDPGNCSAGTPPGITITESSGSTATSEGATTDSFTVELDAEPASDVVIDVTVGDATEGSVDKSTLTFTTANWDTPQTVTVTGQDDDIIDGTISYNITVATDDASSDDDFDGLSETVSVDNTDDDVAGITITESSGSTATSEGATTDSFTVELDAEPASNVVIDVTVGDATEGSVDKSTLTFTTANWDTPQTVTVTGQDDDIIDGTISYNITVATDDASSDDDFDGLSETVSVDNTDDDVAGITITESSGSTATSEGATADSFTVELDAEPASNVVIDVTVGDATEGSVDKSTLTFTTANWDTPQTVTVTGQDDDIIDGTISYNITVATDDASSDDDFDGLSETVSVDNTDDDVAGITITESSGSTATSEGATTDSFTVELDAEPASDVVIDVTVGDATEGSVDKSTLTFTTANWDTPQTVTVTGQDDDIIDGTISYNITVATDDASSDDDFDGLSETVSVDNTDDDVAGFTLVESAGTTATAESGTTDTYTVVLDAEPGSNVVIDVSSDDTGENTVDKSSLTFTTSNWDTPQTVTVTGVDDDIIDGTQTSTITMSIDAASSDDNFDGLSDQTVSVDNTDDDVAGITITESSGSTATSEGATTDSFTVELDAEPSSDVVLDLSVGDATEGTVDKSTLTFTTTNWDTPQTVTVTGQDDDIIDGTISYNITVATDDASSDDDFDGLSETVSVDNTDDDVAGFTLVESAGTTATAESGTTDTYTVVLDAEPGSNVVIDVSSDDTGENTVDKSSLTFTTSNWDTPQTVTVTGVDDEIIDGTQTSTITMSIDAASSDDNFDGLSDQTVSVDNTDDDVAGITITESSGSTATSEGATTDSFTVELDAEPSIDVVLDISVGDATEGAVDKSTLTFTTTNWDTPQTVTVTGQDDDIIDGTISYNITVATDDASSDDDFDGLSETVSVDNTDDDVAGFTLVESAGTTATAESGTTDTYTVVLDAEPGSNVVIDVSSDDTGENTVDKSSLTFTTSNWDTPQTVTVTGVDDEIIDGTQTSTITMSIDAASSDDNFDGLSDQTVSVDNTDDDVAGITITESSGSTATSEGATTDSFTVELDAEPSSDVVLDISVGDATEGALDKSTLTFTTTNWDTPQTVTVTGQDDDIIDGTISYNITVATDDASSDDDFDGLSETVSVDNTDDDVAGFTLVESAGTTATAESGTTDTYTVVLDAEPGSNVVIDVSSDDTGENTVDKSSLTFTTSNWDTPQTVTVTGVDDEIIDGTQTSTITMSIDAASSDDNFDGLSDQTVSLDNTDDDVAGITITESSGSTATSEGATTDSFTVELDAEPSSDVVLDISVGDATEGALDKSTLTFTTTNWDTPQTVTVTGQDDDIIDGTISYNITVATDDASSDDDFDGLSETVSVDNTDDDVAGFTLVESAGTTATAESGTTDTYTVVLDAQPTSNVLIDVSESDDEGTLSTSQLTFTPSNWNTAQTVTVTGVDDNLIDGNVGYNVTLSINDAGSDDDFDALADQTVSVTNEDNDAAGFTLGSISGNTTEAGGTATFTVVLDAQPTSNVLIDVSESDDEGTLSSSQLTFTPSNWNTAQTVTVTGVDDNLIDGNVDYNVTLSINDAGSDDDFDALADQTVSVTNEDIQADLSISQVVNVTSVEIDETVVFTLTAKNNGPAQATNVVVSDLLPGGFQYVSDDGNGAYDAGSGNWSIGNLASGSSSSLNITATANSSGSYDNNASVSSEEDDPDDTNNNASVTVQVLENNAPVVQELEVQVSELNGVNGSVANVASDPNGHNLVYSVTEGPSSGTLSFNSDGSFTYVPDPVFTGTVTFQFKVCDDGSPSLCTQGTVSLVVPTFDSDGDGIPNNEEGAEDSDGDGTADYEDTDSDGDGISDEAEGTKDTDGDGIEDYKDTDSDGDGLTDKEEGGEDTDGDGIPDNEDTDSDGDGIADADEGTEDTDGDGTPDFQDTDSDNDGISDEEEGNDDSDGDGLPDNQDTDSDGDGINDAEEGNEDIDGDGIADYLDTDSDGDGISDEEEGTVDTDGDGTPDNEDTDSDGDGIEDGEESSIDDCDGDGIPDNLDPYSCDDLEVNNVFTPNFDGINDELIFNGIENFPNNTFRMFNRWGNLVFEVRGYDNLNNVFTGSANAGGTVRNNSQLPDGTYFFILDRGDGSDLQKGFITIKK